MPKVRRAVILIFAALVTLTMAGIGLIRAMQVWDDLVASNCPAPPVASPPPAPVCATPPVAPAPPPAPSANVNVAAVEDDALEIVAGGKRLELPACPHSEEPGKWYTPDTRLTTAVVSPDGRQIAIAGLSHGASDSEGRVPSCLRVAVRLYGTADGAHIRDLRQRWDATENEHRVLAIAFDERSERLAFLNRAIWSDCMWDGASVELYVYRLSDGARLVRRYVSKEDNLEKRTLTFTGDDVKVVTADDKGRRHVRVVRVPADAS